MQDDISPTVPPPPPALCPSCGATLPPCPDCEGSGTMLEPDLTLTEWVEQICQLCLGTGASDGPCVRCGPDPSVTLGSVTIARSWETPPGDD